MKIYTRTGDKGETALYGGKKVSKTHARIKAFGSVDELNAFLGLASAEEAVPDLIATILTKTQSDLFHLGAELATPEDKEAGIAAVGESDIVQMERWIDEMESRLKPLKTFILPGGGKLSASLHVARTVCRRAERKIVALSETAKLRSEVVQYTNRLGDLLFVMARYANLKAGLEDRLWNPKT